MEYNFKEVEKKWQSYWQENKTYRVEVDPSKPKYYVLDMSVSLPIRGRVARGTPARLHRFRHLFPLQTLERIQRPTSHGI